MSKPKKHAEFAASSSERWMNCRASLLRSKSAPPQVEGAAAKEGTIAHDLMEDALNLEIKNVVKFFERDEKYPLEMRKHVQGLVDFTRKKLKDGFELLVEEKVVLDGVITDDEDGEEAFGTVDISIVEPFGTLEIIDFKYGQGFVNHVDNSQMIFYALGIAHKLHYDLDEVRTTIYQPRSGSDRPDRTDSFNVKKLLSWRDRFREAIELAKTAHKDDVTAGSWCKFCPAKIDCPAISKSALEEAQLDFKSVVQPDPKSLTSDQLKAVLDRAAYLELWIKEVKEYAEEQVRAGMKIKGWGLKEKKAQRVWKNPQKIVVPWAVDHGIEFTEKTVKSVAVIEKQLKALKIPKADIEKFMKANVVAVSSGDKLASTTNDFDALMLDTSDID